MKDVAAFAYRLLINLSSRGTPRRPATDFRATRGSSPGRELLLLQRLDRKLGAVFTNQKFPLK
jgi:hypothetical protein